jgi:glutamine synthetase
MNDSKGGPFFADPRQVLRHSMKPLQDMGLTAVCATELEFYLL